MGSSRRALAVALSLVGALVGSRADATVMVEVPLEDMARDAVAIVRGRVIHSGTQLVMSAGSLDPHTVTTVQVLDWIKGEEEAPQVVIRELGGTYGPNGQGGGMWIDGTPRYAVGEEVIVFLERDPNDPAYYRTYAMSQGKFVVIHGLPGVPAAVARDTRAIAFAQWASGRMTISHGGREVMQLDAFVDLVRGAARLDAPAQDSVGGAR